MDDDVFDLCEFSLAMRNMGLMWWWTYILSWTVWTGGLGVLMRWAGSEAIPFSLRLGGDDMVMNPVQAGALSMEGTSRHKWPL